MLASKYNFKWGWKPDPNTKGYPWVLYVDLPNGQCSFHSADRLQGPDYLGEWNPGDGSEKNILKFCDNVAEFYEGDKTAPLQERVELLMETVYQ